MKSIAFTTAVVCATLLLGAAGVRADALPADAIKRIRQFSGDAAAVQKRADDETRTLLATLLKDLQALQDTYTRQAKLDEAVTIRDLIRQLRAAPLEEARLIIERLRAASPEMPGAAQVITGEKLPPVSVPAAQSPYRKIAGQVKQQNGLKATFLALSADKVVGDLVWTGSGDAFYALTNDGSLSRVSFPGFVEERRLDIGRRCSFLALSADGILVALTDMQEVWLLNPTTLAVKKRFAAPGVQRVLSSPELHFAVAAGDGATLINLVTGESSHEPQAPTQFARITPDGRFYFAQGGIEQLMSFRIEGLRLIKHQMSGRIAQNGQAICVSPDSKYVCLPSGGGNYGTLYSTQVFPVDNLQKPEFTINSGAYPRMVGFDPKGGFVYAQNSGSQLLIYTLTAIKRAEYNLTTDRGLTDEPRQFVAHPLGRRFLIHCGAAIIFAEVEL